MLKAQEIIHIYFPHSSIGKESACNAGDPGSIAGLGRSTGEGIGYPLQYSWVSLVAQLVKNPPGSGRSPREGKGYPLQYSSLENPMNCIVHGVTKSQTRLSNFHFHIHTGKNGGKTCPSSNSVETLI